MTSLLPSQNQPPPQSQQQQQHRRIGKHGTAQQLKIGRISVVQAAVLCATSAVIAFYIGMILGSSAVVGRTDCVSPAEVKKKVQEALQQTNTKSSSKSFSATSRDTDPRFPNTMQDIAVGMAQVQRDEFNQKFDFGLPLDPSEQSNSEVLILYNSKSALPSDSFINLQARSQTSIPHVGAHEATKNCDNLHIILQNTGGRRRQCTAIMGQYEAFHIQKFMRLPESGPLDPSAPLRLVNRGAQSSGRKSLKAPELETTQQYWESVTKYLGQLNQTLAVLKPYAEKAAVQNSIVVQVCNFGQSELLINFLCSTRRRGLDTSSILVFATDQETYDLVQQMGGVNVVFLQDIFADMPSKAARSYGDKSFMKMMMAKVYCVHLVAMLGFDVLFQDVDVVWYTNPLAYFHNKDALDASFDVYFQDDGNHALFYAPYSANTGFYYVRSNVRTMYFLNSFLMAGDLVIESRSHQIPLVALLQEHASMYGLKIKIFSRSGDDFPGGHAYHRRKGFMKDMVEGKVHPYIFHMSWTSSKINKRKFFQQMGEWYLDDKCTGKPIKEIYSSGISNQLPDSSKDMFSDCCAAEPNIVCHYRDKPSKISCKDSPPIDKNGRSFW